MVRCRSLVAGILASALVGCTRGAPVAPEPSPNVLLITIDTLRADALGSYGNRRAATPILDRLAAAGVRFSHAYAHNVVTLPSHANILSGRYPFHHGVRENAGFRFPRSMDTLATLLKSRGYRTGAFVSAFPLDRRFGLDRGFDVYDDRYGKSDEHSAFRVPERPAPETVGAAMSWIGASPADPPFFAWVHLYEPHFPYAPPEPFASRFGGAPYAGEVATVDAALAPLLQPIVERGSGRPTVVVVTGDHGESLGEHGEMTHGLFAYDATLEVPLIVYAPGRLAPRVVGDPVRHVDVAPTILAAAGAPVPPGLDGRSLLPLASGERTETAPSYFESLSASLNRGWAPLHGIVRGSMKYIDLPIVELYDVARDPGEQSNLASSRPDEVRELQRLLALVRQDDRAAPRGSESADTRERLRSLGYATGAAPARAHYTEADDPKRLIYLDKAIEEVIARYQRGDLRGAIAQGRELLRQRPDMPLVLVHLGFLYNEIGDHRSAIAAIRRALALNPDAQDVAALAGAYLTEAGTPGEAVRVLEPYVRRADPDVDVLVAYGVALASDNRAGDALAAFERARAIDPTNAMPLVDIGTVHLMAGRQAPAAAAFVDALRVDPRAARAHNGLGVIAAERQAWDEAIAHWRQAAALDPSDAQSLYNLGDAFVRLGRPAEARPYWERYVLVTPAARDAADVARVRQWLARH